MSLIGKMIYTSLHWGFHETELDYFGHHVNFAAQLGIALSATILA